MQIKLLETCKDSVVTFLFSWSVLYFTSVASGACVIAPVPRLIEDMQNMQSKKLASETMQQCVKWNKTVIPYAWSTTKTTTTKLQSKHFSFLWQKE